MSHMYQKLFLKIHLPNLLKMTKPRCAWGTCNSDVRYKHKEYMKGVKFFTFPKPVLGDDLNANTIKCLEWISACSIPDEQLNIKKIAEDIAKKIHVLLSCLLKGMYR